MYARTGSRGFARPRGPKPSVISAIQEIQSTLAGPLIQSTNLGAGLIVDIGLNAGQSTLKGYKLREVRGYFVAVPTVAPAAGLKGLLYMGIAKVNENIGDAFVDPSLATTRDQVPWMYLTAWAQPYTAAPVGASQTIEASRYIRVVGRRGKPLRVMREQGDTVKVYLSTAGTETWAIAGFVRTWWTQP